MKVQFFTKRLSTTSIIMVNSYVLFICLAIILLIDTEYVSSGKCDSFKDVVVKLIDINGDKFNKTVNGCIHMEQFHDRTVRKAEVSHQNVPGEDSVRNMVQLVTIRFWHCELNVVEPFAFRNVPKLKLVEISDCNLKEIPNDVFNAIPSLNHLSFDHNKIDYIENKAFANLISLKEVYGSNNSLEYWNREWFDGSINLEVMDFRYNKIRTIPREAFSTLGKLKYIFFDYNEISTIQTDAFKGLRNLEKLLLRGNRLTVINEDIFPNEIKVTTLYLGGNYLNFLSIKVLKKITVKEVDLHHNPWICPCLDRINQWLLSTNGTLLKANRTHFWVFSTNGTLPDNDVCDRSYIPICAYSNSYSQTCLEYVDNELTQYYLEHLRGFNEPWLEYCARLD